MYHNVSNKDFDDLRVDVEEILPAKISPEDDLITKNRKMLDNLYNELIKAIEHVNPSLLREQMVNTYSYLPKVGVLAAKAEKAYRNFQKKAVDSVPKSHRSDSRKFWLDGYCCNYREQRDILSVLRDDIKSKLSLQKSIMQELLQEKRDATFEES